LVITGRGEELMLATLCPYKREGMDVKNARKTLVHKSKRKRPLGRPKRRWEDSIKEGSYGNGV
jgi:hypothetical protein